MFRGLPRVLTPGFVDKEGNKDKEEKHGNSDDASEPVW